MQNENWLSDEQIVARVAAGERELFGLLWKRHRGWSLAFARKLAGGEGEDAHQAAWTGVFQAIVAGGGPQRTFAAYLNRAVRNAAIDRVTKGGAEPVGGVSDMERYTPDVDACARESSAAVRAVEAFNTLPERQRRALWESVVEGHTPAEMAPRMGMTPNAVAVLTYRARESLRQAWSRQQGPVPIEARAARSRTAEAVNEPIHQERLVPACA